MYEEDKQWCHFILDKGFKILFSPHPNIRHYASGSNQDKDKGLNIQRTILKNEFQFISSIKGRTYAKVFFFLKAIQYYTSKYSQAKALVKIYLKFVFTN